METISKNITNHGFSVIPKELYMNDTELLFALQASYHRLSKDAGHGGRYRAYASYKLIEGKLILDEPQAHDNQDAIEAPVLNNGLLQKIIKTNIDIATLSGEVDFSTRVNIGVHQIRYCATGDLPSYASPLGFHRDNEGIVFTHLLNLSANSFGGDNLISKTPERVDKSIRLRDPLETLVVSKKHLHALTPIGSQNNAVACRDILLVTFDDAANTEKTQDMWKYLWEV